MSDRELEDANIRELAHLRHELADLTNPKKQALGPPEFMKVYIQDLERRISALEKELEDLPKHPRQETHPRTATPKTRPPDLETFARQFRQRYGREMRAEEKYFYELTKDLLDHPPGEKEEEAKSA